MSLLEKVAQEKPTFADKCLTYLSPNDKQCIEMFTECYAESDYQSINVHKVDGTTHPDYQGKSWLHLLHNGNRMKSNLRMLEENPAYYSEDKKKKPLMSFIILEHGTELLAYFNGSLSDDPYDKQMIFVEHGNERTCIARFASYYEGATSIKGIKIRKYTIDFIALEIYARLERIVCSKKLNWSIEVNKELVSRDYEKPDDPSEWMITKNKLSVTLTNRANGFSMPVDYSAIYEIENESQKIFRAFTGKYKELWRK